MFRYISYHHRLKKIEIKVLVNGIPYKYLGITSSLNGKQKNELQLLIKKAIDGARVFKSFPITRYQSYIYMYLNTHLHPKIFHPLTGTSLYRKKYQQLKKTYINPAISSTGYNRAWSLAIRYGTHNYGGVGIKGSIV